MSTEPSRSNAGGCNVCDSAPAREPARALFCLLGITLDAMTLDEAVHHVREAVAARRRLFVSTPNLNFLIASQRNPQMRDSVTASDLSLADGMPLIWLARLLGLPIRQRVSGSDLFERLYNEPLQSMASPMRVYFFGGPPGVAQRAHEALNASSSALVSVGFASPGFGSVEHMSDPQTIAAINASQPDFLLVALGAVKGQAWIQYNLDRLQVPVVSHLGAVVNFVAGTVRRSPGVLQRLGLEWLWRIKEEPTLWRRYWSDGVAAMRLMFRVVAPYAWVRFKNRTTARTGTVRQEVEMRQRRLCFSGDLPEDCGHQLGLDCVGPDSLDEVIWDFTEAGIVPPSVWAQALRWDWQMRSRDGRFRIVGVDKELLRAMRYNGVAHLPLA